MSRKQAKSRSTSIAVCVIARDEERFIAECLESARPFVDEIVVLDTGSIDRTREIAREHGARVVEFTWINDFAAARNAAIDAASTDWVLMLDADERLEPESGPVLRGLPARMPANAHGACPRIESRSLSNTGSYSIAGQVPRFFRRSPDIRYSGAIHEDLVYLPDPAASRNVLVNDLRVVHYGYDSSVYADKDKDQRNTRLLQQQIANHPEDARLLYFLAQQHHAMGRHAECIEYGRRFLERATDVRSGFLVETYAMLLRGLIALERDAEVAATAQMAEANTLLGAAACEGLAGFEEQRGNSTRALDYLRRALDPTLPEGVTHDDGLGGWATRLRLAELYDRRGQATQALDQLEHAYGELSQEARGVVALQAAALAVRGLLPEQGRLWLERARGEAVDTIDAQAKLFEVAVAVGQLTSEAELDALERAVVAEDWQAAYDAARVLPAVGAASQVRLVRVAAELRGLGAPEAGLQLLERALDILPDDRQVYWELVRTLTDLGRYDDADAALQVLEGVNSLAA